MNRPRVFIALLLSMVVLFAYPVIYNKLFPPKPVVRPPVVSQQEPSQPAAEQATNSNQSAAPAAATVPAAQPPATPQQPQGQSQQETPQQPPRDIAITTPYWNVVLSTAGATAKSWVLHHYKDNGGLREIKNSHNGDLELIPQNIPEQAPRTFSLLIPGDVALEDRLKVKTFEVTGADESNIDLATGSREITFHYSFSDGAKEIAATKTFIFYADRMYFDVKADVTRKENQQIISQPAHLVLGPRFGDQSDEQATSYSSPSQVVSYTADGSREYALAAKITEAFATIKEVPQVAENQPPQIVIDKQPPAALDRVKIVTDKGATLIGYASVTAGPIAAGENRFLLTLDPQTFEPKTLSLQPGFEVAPAIDIHQQKRYRWAGASDHYFAMVAVPDQGQTFDKIALANQHVKVSDKAGLDYPAVAVPVNNSVATHIFVGPKDTRLLGVAVPGADLGALIDYGFFGFIVRPIIPVLAFALTFFAGLFHNYGWAIVIVTLLINLALSPLRFQSSKKMKKAAKHQPEIKKLQEKMKKLKENPKKNEAEIRKVQEEQIALMREANPLGGCLPLLLQLPIFWAVYLYLQSSLDVRHAPWLYIKDLSQHDPTYILPIVMCATMIASTKLTPQPAQADPSMKMQRIMMTWLMPILLTWFFFFNAPSGLVLYWMVGNIVGVLIQLWINKRTAEPVVETALAGGKPGGANRSGGSGKTGATSGGKNRKNKQRGGAEAEGF